MHTTIPHAQDTKKEITATLTNMRENNVSIRSRTSFCITNAIDAPDMAMKK